MKNVLIHNYSAIMAFLVLFIGTQIGTAQSITNLNRNFQNRACQDTGTVSFSVTANYTGPFSAATTFSLVLSNVEGAVLDTDNTPVNGTTIIQTVPIDLSTNIIEFTFLFPDDLVGSDMYRFQIISSDGNVVSQRSSSFPAYNYTGKIRYVSEPRCVFGSGTLVAEPNDLDSYIWQFSSTSAITGFITIPGENSNSIQATQIGFYRFIEDFGDCINTYPIQFFSNVSEVRQAEGFDISITGPASYEVCSNEIIELSSDLMDSTLQYAWFRDGALLSDIISDDFTVSGSDTPNLTITGIGMEGEYRVGFSSGVIDENSCTQQSDPVIVNLLNPKIEITSEANVLLLAEGQTTILTAEIIRGTAPTLITWFQFNENTLEFDIPLANSNTETFEVSEPGIYTVGLTANSLCPPEDNSVFADGIVTVSAPDGINDIEIAFVGDFDACVSEQAILEVQSLALDSGNGGTITVEGDALNDFVFDWLRDGVSTGETTSSILIDSASDNGTYSVTVGGGTSNTEIVTLALDSFELTANPEVIEEGGSVTLSLGITDTGSSDVYQWFRNTNEEIADSNRPTLENISQPGLYSVQVTSAECGTITVGPIALSLSLIHI